MRIYLIGMPGSGKSTLAEELSTLLSLPFYDMDTEIEEREKKSIPEIFTEKGEDYFRKVEKEVVQTFLPDNSILATGGGAPCFFDNMDFMLENGETVFVDVHEDVLVERVWQQQGTRPLLAQNEKEEVYNAIKEKRESRLPYYSKAEFTIEAGTKTPSELALEIKEVLKK
ncbi:shikimate kinase [Flammeovirga aprica]|uniref:Shikimate kinase n=1 Tax=Flammeovirga aprica JL-4 TaxID=694437 RepID=A0A7X9RRV0_9BACT|nr:shikimate kinase [Flammeovirga aprica]NME68283.1 shikimate kinase [Flammeovirga aprica JL-4]